MRFSLNLNAEPNLKAWVLRFLIPVAMLLDLIVHVATITTLSPGFTLECARQLGAARFKARIPPNRRT